MDNFRRALILITIIFLATAAVVGFGLALNYKYLSGSGVVKELIPDSEKYQNTDNPDATPDRRINSDRLCFMTIIGDSANDTCDIVFTTTFDFSEKYIINVFYPVDISVTRKNADNTYDFEKLSDIYRLGGAEKLMDAVQSFLSIDVSGYLYLDYVNFANLVTYFTSRDEGVDYNVPVDIDVRNENYERVKIDKGSGVFSGSKSVQLIKFYRTYNDVYEGELANFYDGTRFRQTEIAATFIEEFIKQKLVGDIDSYYNDYYLYFLNKFLTSVPNSLPESFVTKMNENYKNISRNDVTSYILGYNMVSGANFSYYQYGDFVERVVNNNGKIIRSKLIDTKLSELKSALF